MITFTDDGNTILVANEGEPREGIRGTAPMGSVTIFDLVSSNYLTSVVDLTFEGFDSRRDEVTQGGVIIIKDTMPSVDL